MRTKGSGHLGCNQGAVATRGQLAHVVGPWMQHWRCGCCSAGNSELYQVLALPESSSDFKLHLGSSSPEFLDFFAFSLSPNLWCSLSCSQGNPEYSKVPNPRRQVCAGPILHRGWVPGTGHMCSQGHFYKVEPHCPPEFTFGWMFFLPFPTGLLPCSYFPAPPPKALSPAMLSGKPTLFGGHIQWKEAPLDLSQ